MLLQIKIYLIAILYFFGGIFMLLFPPRNFVHLSKCTYVARFGTWATTRPRGLGLLGECTQQSAFDLWHRSGAKVRTVRTTKQNDTAAVYLNPRLLLTVVETFAKDNPEAASVVRLSPVTAENRTIVALELRSDTQSRKPGILIVGGLNAMAWGVPNAIIDLAEKLLYDSSYQTPFFNDYDWYLIPCVNPDGLHFTQSMRALPPLEIKQWSKNLTARNTTRPAEWHKNVDSDPDVKDPCFGTNINRNFAYHWQDDVHKTPERCSQFYPGVKPFSTAEAQAIRRYVDALGDRIHLAIHLHASFVPKKEYILYPWRYSLRQPSNFKTLQDIGEYAARQARLPDGRLYEVHQSSNDERVAGSFSDYVCGVVGIDLVYIVKPYHQMFPNDSVSALDLYVNKSLKVMLSIVRGWRRSTKVNTLTFFGRDVEF